MCPEDPSREKLQGLAARINFIDPDAIAVQEIGTGDPLADLLNFLDGHWNRQVSKHPDQRGIRVAWLARQPVDRFNERAHRRRLQMPEAVCHCLPAPFSGQQTMSRPEGPTKPSRDEPLQPHQEVEVSTAAASRRFDIHHLRHDGGPGWRSARLRDVRITAERLRLHATASSDEVEISGTSARRHVDVELRRYDGERLARRTLAAHVLPAGRFVRVAPTDWTRLARGRVYASVS